MMWQRAEFSFVLVNDDRGARIHVCSSVSRTLDSPDPQAVLPINIACLSDHLTGQGHRF
jgi:hypothetical protein